MDKEGRKKIVEIYLSELEWDESGDWAYCQCPGRHLHENPNKPRDTRVYLSGSTVTVHCVHLSCEEKRAEINSAIRSTVASLPGEEETEFTPEDKSHYASVMMLAKKTVKGLPKIYRENWCGPDMLARALVPEESREVFFTLFAPEDIIWVGNVYHSGIPHGNGHFRPVVEWRQASRFWNFTCTGCFKSAGTVFRTKDQVVRQDYFCLEFDKLDPDPIQNQLKSFALFRYLEEVYGLKGRAAIDAANKSIHFWVENNPAILDDDFKLFLKGIGADSASWRPYQPVRFPGVLRRDTNREQGLIML